MAQEVQIRATERGFAQVGASFSRLQKQAGSLKGSMLKLGAGLGLGFGAASLVKGVMNVDAAITRLVIASGKGPEAIGKLRAQVLAASRSTGKSTSDLVAGMHKIVEITGDYDLAAGSVEALGRVSNATGANIEDIAAAAAELGQKMQIKPEGIERVFNILATQGKAGSFELRNMAAGFPSLLSSLAAFNVQGEGGIRTFGAFLQIARRGFGSAEQTVTGVTALMATLRKADVQKRLGGLGIKNVGSTNPVETLMKLVAKTGGNATKIAQVLGGRHEAQAALLPLGQMFRKNGGFGEMLELEGVASIGVIAKDFSTWMTSAAGQLERAKNEMENVAIERLSESVRGLASHGVSLVKGIRFVGDNFEAIAAGLLALKFAPGLIGMLGKAGGVAGAAGALGGAGVTPVFVTNFPAALGGAATGAGAGAAGAGAAAGAVPVGGAGMGKVGIAVLAAAAYEVYKHYKRTPAERAAVISESQARRQQALLAKAREYSAQGMSGKKLEMMLFTQNAILDVFEGRARGDDPRAALNRTLAMVRGQQGPAAASVAAQAKAQVAQGPSSQDFGQLASVLLRAANVMEKKMDVNVLISGMLLDKPPVVRRRGPSQARTGW